MNIDDLKGLCLVTEHRSLAKAARKLGISTAMMTRRIQRIEAELDTQLFQRSTRMVRPTESGEWFYQQAREIIAQYESSVAGLQHLSQQLSGTIKIGLPVSISHLWVTPALHQFITANPEINIHIVNGNHLIGLLSEGFDLVIHCGKLPDVGYYFRHIADWKKLTCASPEYLQKYGAPKHPDDLHKHNCLDHYDNFKSTWTYTINNKETDVYVSGNVKVNSSIDLKNLAISSLGLAYLPDFSIQQEIQSGLLHTVLDQYCPEPLGIYAIYPSKQYLSKRTAAMLDYLTDLLTGK